MTAKEDKFRRFMEDHGHVIANALELNLNDLSAAHRRAVSYKMDTEIALFAEGMTKVQAALAALDEMEGIFDDKC